MYAMSEDRARPPGPGRAEHELPVLFHLMDVSRPRQAPPEASPQAHDASATPETQVPAVIATPNLSPIATDPLPQPAATLEAVTVALPSPISIALSSDLPTTTNLFPISDALLASVTAETVSSANVVSSDNATQPNRLAATDNPPAPTTESASATASEAPKNQLAARRKHKTPAGEDWFATHGKYIALGFVLALIGTIWLANSNRQRANPAPTASTWKSPLADETPSGHDSSPAIGTPASHPVNSTVLVSADSQVELHPPVTPQVAADKAGKDKLFDFSSPKSEDERVATRPDDRATQPPLSGQKGAPGNTAEGPAPAATGTPSSAPALSLAYPTTSPPAPAPSYPAAVTPTNSYPQTAAPALVGPNSPVGPPTSPTAGYSAVPQGWNSAAPNDRSQFPVPPGATAPRPSAWPATPSGASLPGHYQSLDNSARGPRNERTGSGNY